MPSLSSLYSQNSCTKFELFEQTRESIVEILHQSCGMGTYQFQSRDNDEVFCKIKYDEEVLLQEAETTHYLLQMKKELEDNEIVKKTMPFVPYIKEKSSIYQSYDNSVLKDIDRIRLMEQIIRAHINIESLIKYKILVDFYPIHNIEEMSSLKKSLMGWSLNPMNPDLIRNYIGEKFCLYFLWLEFYAQQLFYLGILGVGVWLFSKFSQKNKEQTLVFQ
jgi:Calcium-activated chloride channel.